MYGKREGGGDGFVAGLRAWVDTLAWPRSAALAGPELAYQSGTASQAAVEIEIVVVGVAVVVYIITVKITVATCLFVCVRVYCKLFSNGECGLSKCELTIEANSRPLSLSASTSPSLPFSIAIKSAYQFRATARISTPRIPIPLQNSVAQPSTTLAQRPPVAHHRVEWSGERRAPSTLDLELPTLSVTWNIIIKQFYKPLTFENCC